MPWKTTFIGLLALSCAALQGDPWGKDADLAARITSPQAKSCTTPLFGGFAERAIQFHQEVISPADGPRSHFTPSSSQYTLDAMRSHGFLKGFIMGCDRLMRENNDPWIYRHRAGVKYDPVP